VSDWGKQIPGGWFDEERHIYRDDSGMIVPATTQVFSILGMNEFEGVPEYLLEWKRNYGSAVHRAVHYMMDGDLDWDSLDEAIIPAVTGIQGFLKSLNFTCHAAEVSSINSICGMRYGLTVDLVGEIFYRGENRKAVVDLKSGVKASPTWKWQLGGYVAAQGSGQWLGVIAQFDKAGIVTPHYVDIFPAQREFQILLAAAILKLNNGLAKIGG
jgi:hypothetical protein